MLNDQFSSVFTTDSPSDFPHYSEWFSGCQYPNVGDAHVATEGIEKLLGGVNLNKAMSPHGLHPRLLKKPSITIAPILLTIFSKSLEIGKVPSHWKTVNICPMFKKGERYHPAPSKLPLSVPHMHL